MSRIKGLLEELEVMEELELVTLFKNESGHVVAELINSEAKNYRVVMRDNRYEVPGYKYSFTLGIEETLEEALEMAQELVNPLKEELTNTKELSAKESLMVLLKDWNNEKEELHIELDRGVLAVVTNSVFDNKKYGVTLGTDDDWIGYANTDTLEEVAEEIIESMKEYLNRED